MFFHSVEQSRVQRYPQPMIMHARPDTNIHGGMERDRSGTQCARDRGGLFRFFLSISEKIAFSGDASKMRWRREPRRFPRSRLYSFSTETNSGGIAYWRLPPKISKLFEPIKRMVANTIPSILGSREHGRSMRFVKFTDTFEKRDSRRCLARVNPLRIVSIVISVNYNETISEKSR